MASNNGGSLPELIKALLLSAQAASSRCRIVFGTIQLASIIMLICLWQAHPYTWVFTRMKQSRNTYTYFLIFKNYTENHIAAFPGEIRSQKELMEELIDQFKEGKAPPQLTAKYVKEGDNESAGKEVVAEPTLSTSEDKKNAGATGNLKQNSATVAPSAAASQKPEAELIQSKDTLGPIGIPSGITSSAAGFEPYAAWAGSMIPSNIENIGPEFLSIDATETRLRFQYESYFKLFNDTVFIITLPVVGAKISIGDIGVLGGALLLVLSTWYYYTSKSELTCLEVLFNQARIADGQSADPTAVPPIPKSQLVLSQAYLLAALQQVIVKPRLSENHHLSRDRFAPLAWVESAVIYVLIALPVVVQGYAIFVNKVNIAFDPAIFPPYRDFLYWTTIGIEFLLLCQFILQVLLVSKINFTWNAVLDELDNTGM